MLSKRSQNRIDQRQRILDAARRLFTEQSFEIVTMSDVAAVAGVARATVFNYFPSKYSLVESITEDVYGYFCGMIEAARLEHETPTPTLVRALFVHMAGLESERRFYTGIFREVMKIQHGLDEGGSAQHMRAVTIERLAQLMERGQLRGDISNDHSPLDLAHAFEILANGTIVRWLYDDGAGSLRDRMRSSAAIFLGSVAIGPQAAAENDIPDLVPIGPGNVPQDQA